MADSSDNCGDSEHPSDSSTSSETPRSSWFSSEASKEYSKQAKRRKKRKHAEDWWDSSDTCDTIETKKLRRIRLQNIRQSERKGKRKSAGNHGKALNVSLSEEPECQAKLVLPFSRKSQAKLSCSHVVIKVSSWITKSKQFSVDKDSWQGMEQCVYIWTFKKVKGRSNARASNWAPDGEPV